MGTRQWTLDEKYGLVKNSGKKVFGSCRRGGYEREKICREQDTREPGTFVALAQRLVKRRKKTNCWFSESEAEHLLQVRCKWCWSSRHRYVDTEGTVHRQAVGRMEAGVSAVADESIGAMTYVGGDQAGTISGRVPVSRRQELAVGHGGRGMV